jgi:hypothetical protein
MDILPNGSAFWADSPTRFGREERQRRVATVKVSTWFSSAGRCLTGNYPSDNGKIQNNFQAVLITFFLSSSPILAPKNTPLKPLKTSFFYPRLCIRKPIVCFSSSF